MLTKEKREEIRDLLSQVNISAICSDLNICRDSVYRTLNGNGRRWDDLIKVVEAAKEQVSEVKSRIESL